jgi:hypothetical protein
MSTIQKVVIATAFSAAVAGALTGVAISGETKEPIVAVNCSATPWPMIPAECLEETQSREVRFITSAASANRTIQERFDVAFQ